MNLQKWVEKSWRAKKLRCQNGSKSQILNQFWFYTSFLEPFWFFGEPLRVLMWGPLKKHYFLRMYKISLIYQWKLEDLKKKDHVWTVLRTITRKRRFVHSYKNIKVSGSLDFEQFGNNQLILISLLTVLNLILINFILSWLMGTAIRPPNSKYTQNVGYYTAIYLWI